MWSWNLSKFYRYCPIWIFFHNSSHMIKKAMQNIQSLHEWAKYQGFLSAESTETASALLSRTSTSLPAGKSCCASGDGNHKKNIPRGQHWHDHTSHSCSCSLPAQLSAILSADSVSPDNPAFLHVPQSTQHNLQSTAMQTWLLQAAKKVLTLFSYAKGKKCLQEHHMKPWRRHRICDAMSHGKGCFI